MVVGEAASVLGISEREASDRLHRLIPAVEAASRALFLIRFGRPRDPDLDALLSQLNITRLTPEARASIAGALPWLPLVDEETTAIDLPTAALPEEPAHALGADVPTGVTPVADPWAYGANAPVEEQFGTRALDISVRQRVVREEPVYIPPRSTTRAMGPLALLGLLGGALVIVVGALVLFLV